MKTVDVTNDADSHNTINLFQQKTGHDRADNADIRGKRQVWVKGQVAIVGAGPGDPDLLTVKALKLIQQADVLVYDRLVSEEIVALTEPDCEKIYVGKRCGFHAMKQEEINQLLVNKAQENKRVLRLKGGDPFIFGRGSEEVHYLASQGIRSLVVPGITAASGCTTYAGIPLTHRDCTQICTFVTGHLKHGKLALPWRSLVDGNQTVVFYMGLSNAGEISTQLQHNGRSATTPVALIENGTTGKQRVVVSTLENVVADIDKYAVTAPALIVVGEVVNYQMLAERVVEEERNISL